MAHHKSLVRYLHLRDQVLGSQWHDLGNIVQEMAEADDQLGNIYGFPLFGDWGSPTEYYGVDRLSKLTLVSVDGHQMKLTEQGACFAEKHRLPKNLEHFLRARFFPWMIDQRMEA